jgi:hypothetical protein
VTPFEYDRYLQDRCEATDGPLVVFPTRRRRAGPHARPRRLPWKAVARRATAAPRARRRLGRRDRRAPTRPGGGLGVLPGRCASATCPSSPLLLLVSGAQLADLELRDDLFDDFCLTRSTPRARGPAAHLFWRRARRPPELVEYGRSLSTSRPTRRSIAGRPLDLTYMEYELLKFLAQHPGKVFTREIAAVRVWGYEYYGGARTVDVHVRRLRAKLGEEHAALISTVRSVGYRFGQSRGAADGSGGDGDAAIAGWARSLPRMRLRVGPRLPTGREVAALTVA